MENISNLIVTAVAIIGAITAAIIGGLTIWTFRDIRSRSRDFLVQILATVMVGVIPVAGILVYFMLRPRETLAEGYVRALEEESLLASIEHQEFCPSCGRRVESDMVLCPTCHSKLRNPCPNCQRAVHLSWDMCPYCSSPLQPEAPVIGKSSRKRVSAPPPAQVQMPTQTTSRSLPTGTPAASRQLPEEPQAIPEERAPSGINQVLDKVGGAIEGIFNRINARGSTTAPAVEEAPVYEDQPPPPRYMPASHVRPTTIPEVTKNDGAQKGSNGQIKPLISRDEPLE
jgi:hypothetical protein